jgi:hypothetical protein
MRTLMMVAGLLALAGCATTPEEKSAQVRADVEQMIATYGPACDRLGFKPDDDKWRDCVLRLAQRDERRYYYRYPVTTSCIGHRGFFNCTTF